MTPLQAIILGLVEGITEYLPVSSTGHLILAAAFLKLDDPSVKSSVDAFNIVIQGGAILAVLGLYFPRVLSMLRGLIGKDRDGLRLAINILIAFLPAAVLGVLLDDWISSKLFSPGPVIAALIVGGVYMIALDIWRKKKYPAVAADAPQPGLDINDLTPTKALIIGVVQCIAMWPGTSRSMMTITAGVMAGLRPAKAAEFSFLLGLPTLGGACCYKLLKNLKHASETGEANLFEQLGYTPVVLGIVVAAVSAAFAVKWLVGFLNKHGLTPFGVYRIILGVVLGALVLADIVKF
ncbi:MAG: undecaprenyl-diphosphate phosphatase [Phycisphaeraceae bacterium]|nr:undecaprenyl-diphosphate phosphatase [Phycisphaeraceae bacterium]MBX3366676.1 undecaprenyl-diphosphate phosphatase [Phycisphaeraceae bacterium]